ncbi:MAG: hypothetical protein LQ339_004207 [Xanthoria mediterranea]|nr:MAG: hypothetical protein LQ339_004207 [Xanthoria mediterranea]
MKPIKPSFLTPLSLFLFTLLLRLSLALSIPLSKPPTTHLPSTSQLSLPHPPDPLVLHRIAASIPPTTLAIKFYSYGARNDVLHVQHLLEYAGVAAAIEESHETIPRNRPLQYPGEDTLQLDFNPGVGVTWGEWTVMLDAMKEFIAWYESRDFLFEVRVFERGKAPRGGGAGILWTGLLEGES